MPSTNNTIQMAYNHLAAGTDEGVRLDCFTSSVTNCVKVNNVLDTHFIATIHWSQKLQCRWCEMVVCTIDARFVLARKDANGAMWNTGENAWTVEIMGSQQPTLLLPTAGGSFAITKVSLKPATSKWGNYQLIKCHHRGGGDSRSKQVTQHPNDSISMRESRKPSAKVHCPWGYILSTPTLDGLSINQQEKLLNVHKGQVVLNVWLMKTIHQFKQLLRCWNPRATYHTWTVTSVCITSPGSSYGRWGEWLRFTIYHALMLWLNNSGRIPFQSLLYQWRCQEQVLHKYNWQGTRLHQSCKALERVSWEQPRTGIWHTSW